MQKRGKAVFDRKKCSSKLNSKSNFKSDSKRKALQQKLNRLKPNSAKRHMGMRALIEYTALLIVGGIINVSYNFMKPNKLVQNFPPIQIFEVFLIVWLLCVLWGFFDRKHWVWLMSMGCFSVMLMYSLFLHYQLRILEILSFELFLLLSLLSLLMNCTVIWYIYQKKLYFTNPYFVDKYTLTDKIFVNMLICLVVLILAISITIFKLSGP